MSEHSDPNANRNATDAGSADPPGPADTNADTNAAEPSLQEHHNPETDEDTASGGSA
jgi:hypothetical protein